MTTRAAFEVHTLSDGRLRAYTQYDAELTDWLKRTGARFHSYESGRKAWTIAPDARHADVFIREMAAAGERAKAKAVAATDRTISNSKHDNRQVPTGLSRVELSRWLSREMDRADSAY